MTISDLPPKQQETAMILQPLMYAFPNAKITGDTICTYAIALSELSKKELQAAVLKCMRTCKFLPSIAEIMEQAQNMVEVATGTKTKSPDEAWKEVLDAQWRYWPYKEPIFSTDAIKQTVFAMGWRNMCTSEQKDIGITRAQFLKLYDSVCKRKHEARIDDNVLKLAGITSLTAGKMKAIE